jgi:Mn-dependent DtxR family transcriptional regulator
MLKAEDPGDTTIRMISERGGSSSITDLLAPPFESATQMMTVLQKLQDANLIEMDAQRENVRLTNIGKTIAEKLTKQQQALSSPP